MLQKTVVLSVVVALMLLGLFVDPSVAQQNNNVTKVDKRGSLLVYPLVITTAGYDTIIKISNDGQIGTVWVKCYWMDGATQVTSDIEFPLTDNQPVYFSATTGIGSKSIQQFGPDKIGELKCWAIDVNPPDLPPPNDFVNGLEALRAFNFLTGSAMIVTTDSGGDAFEYQAWAFQLNTLVPADRTGPLNLNGTQYDYCPNYLVYNFFAQGATGIGSPGTNVGPSFLALSPCQEDVRSEANLPVCAKAKFDIWNENEFKFTGAYQCVKCYFEGELDRIGKEKWVGCDLKPPLLTTDRCKFTGKGGDFFTFSWLKTKMARFRVLPEVFTACKGVFSHSVLLPEGIGSVDVCGDPARQFKTPFVGVLYTRLTANPDSFAATTGTAAGAFVTPTQTGGTTPQIIWDPGTTFVPAAKR